ncbi:endonuclease III [Marivirga harenae]|uniref:endonuclease III n=1 Tax=Marivirga harenae TaxID=2010992 RepID=UPI0026DEAA30|nr:endonuclease III [Marivirga harenae]WKV13538.1 endonuclease III [Marivirga harenae]|tara:strand:- start:176313 stop:176972 length:660 start_codon:yes stop_codon:yes gene_type:complete
MTRKERYEAFLDYFSKNQPQAETELHYENPYQLLVAVILSAQCTDKRVNIVTPALFEAFPTPEHLANSHFDEVLPYIKSISFMNNKTKHLLGMAKILVEDFDSVVPESIDDLQKMPGVGRKTANVIASVIYNQPAMAVDTHVFRVSKRLGLVNQNAKTPLEVEKTLIKHIPSEYVHVAHHWLILHGRYVCVARRPKCEECKITHICRYFEKNKPLEKQL